MEPTKEYASGPHKSQSSPGDADYLYDAAFSDKKPGERVLRPRRVYRRFATRGGELVEIESIVRETR